MIAASYTKTMQPDTTTSSTSLSNNIPPAQQPVITQPAATTENTSSDHFRYMPQTSEQVPGYGPEPVYRKPIVPVEEENKLPDPAKGSGNLNVILGIAAGLLLIVGSVLCYSLWYAPYKKDKEAPRYYTFVNTNLRSSKIAGIEYNRISTLSYGSELIVYQFDNQWADVKWEKTKGYVASPYLLPKEDFFLLNSLFGDAESRECVETAKCRLALLQYYKQNYLYGKAIEGAPDSYISQKNWQVFTKGKNVKPNTVFFPRVWNRNGKYTDFAVIIKNTDTNERRLLLFTFDDETESPSLIYEEQAPATGDIQNITPSGTSIKVTYTHQR